MSFISPQWLWQVAFTLLNCRKQLEVLAQPQQVLVWKVMEKGQSILGQSNRSTDVSSMAATLCQESKYLLSTCTTACWETSLDPGKLATKWSINHSISQYAKEKIEKAFVSRIEKCMSILKQGWIINPKSRRFHCTAQDRPGLQICDSSSHPLRVVQHLSGSQAQCLLSFFQLSCLQERAETLHQFLVDRSLFL